ncbi:hypothetical protein TNIN_281421 [Trichonephila inaurata madagascariensis]|uniref:Uncharacterized protein n=1 Tax=Trichonephila inaurata madagascariensis TaxID=2747483 RepID=A0A8X7BXV0_9ARAC|nr:hypothetical protein TNIN_281421 [Trichonephila inaurata madagascariensis]
MPNNRNQETEETFDPQKHVSPIINSLSTSTHHFSNALMQQANSLSGKADMINDPETKKSFMDIVNNLREIASALTSLMDNNNMAIGQFQTLFEDVESLEKRFYCFAGEIQDLIQKMEGIVTNIRLTSNTLQQISDALQEDEVMSEAGLEGDETE